MSRELVLLTLCGGCLVPNPEWIDTDAGGGWDTGASMTSGVAGTATDNLGTLDGSTGPDPTETGGPIQRVDHCPPADPLPSDTTIVVPAGTPWQGIQSAIYQGGVEAVIALEPGTYVATGNRLWIDQRAVTLTSTTGIASDVILTGNDDFEALVEIEADGVTLSDLTLAQARIGVRMSPETSQTGTTFNRMRFVDLADGIRAADGVPIGNFSDAGVVSCSNFTIRGMARTAETCEGFRAVDVHGGQDWHIRDNKFEGYYCTSVALSKPIVRFTAGSSGVIIERNSFRDGHRMVLLGGDDVQSGEGEVRPVTDPTCAPDYWGHIGGTVRNNVFWNGSEAIAASPANERIFLLFWKTCNCVAYHNTFGTSSAYTSDIAGIEIRSAVATGEAVNNLMTTSIVETKGAVFGRNEANIENALPNEFAALEEGDLHLAAGATAIDAAIAIESITDDIDGDIREKPHDIGADELSE